MEPLIDIQIQDWIDRISADFASKDETLNFATWSKWACAGFRYPQVSANEFADTWRTT